MQITLLTKPNIGSSLVPVPLILASAKPYFVEQRETIKQLAVVASRYPYYRYNSLWTRELQAAVRRRTLPSKL